MADQCMGHILGRVQDVVNAFATSIIAIQLVLQAASAASQVSSASWSTNEGRKGPLAFR